MDAQEQCDRIAANSKQFLVDKNLAYTQVVQERDSLGNTVVYTHGDDLISQDRVGAYGSNLNYYHYDGLGSTRSLTDSGGQTTDTYDYNAYGTVLSKTGTSKNSYLVAGEQYDESTKQYYLRARYYHPDLGRFMQMDTYQGRMGEPVTLHKYLHANGDPVNGVDPSGNVTLAEIEVAAAGLVIVAMATDYTIRSSVNYKANTNRWYGGTPDTHPEDFASSGGLGTKKNTKIGEIWSPSNTNHSGSEGGEWSVGTKPEAHPTPDKKITVASGGTIIKVDK